MAKSINQVILLGRLTRDPEVRSTNSGKSIAQFGLAVSRGGQSEETDFFDITTWDKLADLVTQYLGKGSKVLVQGRLQQDSWDDKETGKKRTKITITANDVTFLDSPSDSTNRNTPLSQNRALEEAGEIRKTQDTVIEDIDDKPIDLSEIPF
jgi:single-strand DNA-binding protein